MKKTVLMVALCAAFVCAVFILPAMLLPYNLDSLCDEGFLFLTLRRAVSGYVAGGTQWASMTAAIFPESVTNNIYALRWTSYLMTILAWCVFSICSVVFLRGKGKICTLHEEVVFIACGAPLFAQCANDLVIAYNQWQTLWLVSAISLFLLQEVVDLRKGMGCYVVIGFLLMMAFFTVLPSAVMVGAAICLLSLIKNWRSPKSLLLQYLLLLVGAGLGVLLVHCFVAPLNEICEAMANTAQTITKLNRGYDPLSFATKILLFFRDYLMQMCMLLGASALGYMLHKKGNTWMGAIVLVGLILICWKYQAKPVFSFSTVCTLPIVWIAIQSFATEGFRAVERMRDYNFYLYTFLFFAPLLCTIGTNVYLGSRMEYYIGIWAVLLFAIDKIEFSKSKLALLLICIVMSFLPKVCDYYQARKSQTYQFDSLVLKNMYLTTSYADYLSLVHEILQSNGYQKGDTIWSTQLDMMVLAVEEATPEGLYFQPMDFASRTQISATAPHFLFVNDYDMQIAGDILEKWGLENEYDVYHFESPEVLPTSYPTDRYLYVRKTNSFIE